MEKNKLDTKKILLIGVPVILLLLLLVIIKNGQGEGDIAQQQTEEAFLPESEEEKVLSKREAYEKERREKEMEAQLANVTYSDNDFFSDMMTEEDGNVSEERVVSAFDDTDDNSSVKSAASSTSGKKTTSATTKKSTSYNSSSSSNNSSGKALSYEEMEAQVRQEVYAKKSERFGGSSTAAKSSSSSSSSSANNGDVLRVNTSEETKSSSVTSGTGARTRTAASTVKNSKNLVAACIHGDQIVTSGGTVRMRLLEDMKIGDVVIPASTIFYGVAQLGADRMSVKVESMKYGSYIAKTEIVIYDNDAIEGLNLPDNIKAQISKLSATQSSSGLDVDVPTSSVGGGIVKGAVKSVAGAIKNIGVNRIQEIKVNLKSNYKIYIK